MLESGASVRLDCKVLYRELLPSRPSHHRFKHFNPLFIRERDGQREGFPWLHGQIPRESPAGAGEIPDCAVSVKGARVVGDGALQREAAVGTNGEGHEGLAGRRIVEGDEGQRKRLGVAALRPPSCRSVHCAIVSEKGIDPTNVFADGLGRVPRPTGGQGEWGISCV